MGMNRPSGQGVRLPGQAHKEDRMADPFVGDTAKRCKEHDCCIIGIKEAASPPNMAGEWHMQWDEPGRRWLLTDPSGKSRDPIHVPAGEGWPPAGLALPGMAMHNILSAISDQGLFPPC
jgi:hypothetical protein